MDLAAIILAGGKGRRFGGRAKALEILAGKTLLERVQERLGPLGLPMLLVTDRVELFPDFPGTLVEDTRTPRGAMQGIVAGLQASPHRSNLVVACDMPFLRPPLLRRLWDWSGGWDLLIPRVGCHVEPLHAVYTRDLIPHFQELLAREDLRMRRILEAPARIREVPERVLRRYDPELRSFRNVNTPEDLQAAWSLAAEEDETDARDGSGYRSEPMGRRSPAPYHR